MLSNEVEEIYGKKLRVRVCGILIADEKMLLVKHNYKENGRFFWAPPGGGLQYGESINDCLKREFLEETGLLIEKGNFIDFNEYLAPPLHAVELFFHVKLLSGELIKGKDPESNNHKQIIEEVCFVAFSDIVNDNKNEYHPVVLKYLSDITSSKRV